MVCLRRLKRNRFSQSGRTGKRLSGIGHLGSCTYCERLGNPIDPSRSFREGEGRSAVDESPERSQILPKLILRSLVAISNQQEHRCVWTAESRLICRRIGDIHLSTVVVA